MKKGNIAKKDKFVQIIIFLRTQHLNFCGLKNRHFAFNLEHWGENLDWLLLPYKAGLLVPVEIDITFDGDLFHCVECNKSVDTSRSQLWDMSHAIEVIAGVSFGCDWLFLCSVGSIGLLWFVVLVPLIIFYIGNSEDGILWEIVKTGLVIRVGLCKIQHLLESKLQRGLNPKENLAKSPCN